MMAGSAKPSNVKTEAPFTFISGSMYSGDGSKLFDGVIAESNYAVGYFYPNAVSHVIVNITQSCNVWEIKNSYPGRDYAPLDFFKYTDGSYVLTRTSTNVEAATNTWKCILSDLEAGQYKITTHSGSGYAIVSEFYFESTAPQNKILFEQNSVIKTWNGTSFVDVGSSPATKAMFDASGLTSLSAVDYSLLTGANNVKILNYVYDNTITGRNTTVTPEYKQILVKSNDVDVKDMQYIDSITLTGSDVKIFISPDSGTTWYSYVNNIWTSYELTNDNLDLYGMTIAELNAINTNFNTFITSKFRFAFLVANGFSVDNLAYQLDLKGTWEGGVDVITTYEIIYGNESITIKLSNPGSYKINY